MRHFMPKSTGHRTAPSAPALPLEVWMEVCSYFLPRKSAKFDLEDPFYKWAVPYHKVDVAGYHRQRLAEAADQETIAAILSVNRTTNAAMRYVLKGPPRSLQSLTLDTPELANERTRTMRKRVGPGWGYRDIDILANDPANATLITALIRDHRHTLQSLTITFELGVFERFPDAFDQVLMELPGLQSFSLLMKCHPSCRYEIGGVLEFLAASPSLKHLALSQIGWDGEPSEIMKVPAQLESLQIRRIRIDVPEHALSSLVSSSHLTLKELNFIYEYSPLRPEEVRWPSWHRGVRSLAVQRVFAPCIAIEVLRIADLIDRDELGIEEELEPDDGFLDDEDPVLEVMVDGMVLPLKNLRVLEMAGKVFSLMGLLNNLNLSGCLLSQLTILLYPEFPLEEFLVELKNGHRALSKLKKLTLGQTVWRSSESDEVRDGLRQLCKEHEIELKIEARF